MEYVGLSPSIVTKYWFTVLAYLFFHRRQPGTDAIAYEAELRRFHAALAGAGIDGFLGSQTYRVGDRYCDWYLVESSAALDALNEAAVSGARSPHHDSVARAAVDGAGKLLRLAAGNHDAGSPFEIGFSKPRGMTYHDLYATLRRWTDRPGVSLWRRMMVLGPAPEFCMLAPESLELPPEMSPEVLRRSLLVDLAP